MYSGGHRAARIFRPLPDSHWHWVVNAWYNVQVHAHVHVYTCKCVCIYTECRGFESHLRQLIFLWKKSCLGVVVLYCVALFVVS